MKNSFFFSGSRDLSTLPTPPEEVLEPDPALDNFPAVGSLRYAATPRTFTPPKDVTDDVVGRAIVVTVRAIVVVGLGTPTFVAVGTLAAGALLIPPVEVSLEPCDGVLAPAAGPAGSTLRRFAASSAVCGTSGRLFAALAALAVAFCLDDSSDSFLALKSTASDSARTTETHFSFTRSASSMTCFVRSSLSLPGCLYLRSLLTKLPRPVEDSAVTVMGSRRNVLSIFNTKLLLFASFACAHHSCKTLMPSDLTNASAHRRSFVL